jgi:hypothetical protein
MRQFYSFYWILMLSWLTGFNTFAQETVYKAASDDLPFIVSSADDTNEHWYFIQFYRKLSENKAAKHNGADAAISQVALDASNDAFRWKFVENGDAYKVVSKVDGTEFLNNATTGDIHAGAIGTGNTFILERHPDGDWRFTDKADSRYLNDRGGSTLCLYGAVDNGSRIVFASADEMVINVTSSTLSFSDVMLEAVSTKLLPVMGVNLTGSIMAVVQGEDTQAFTVENPTIPAIGGNFTIKFKPMQKRAYSATLVLKSDGVEDKIITLSGTADFELPVTISETEGEEHWYFIQFARIAGRKLVVKYNGQEEYITDGVMDFGNDSLKWKIVGDWDNYKIVSKVDGTEMAYLFYNPDYQEGAADSIIDRYITTEADHGDGHGFVRYKDTNTWQLYNYRNTDGPSDHKYINDKNAQYACLYSLNDGGNQLLFFPADKPVIISVPALAFSDIPRGATETRSIAVTGSYLTGNITAALSGAGKEDFTLSSHTLPAAGDVLQITYAPQTARKDSVILTLTSPDADPVEVLLTGNSEMDFPLISKGEDAEYWYFIQFVRSAEKGANNAGKVLQSGGADNPVTQEDWDVNVTAQQWKIVGNWNAYKIVDYDGYEWAYDSEFNRIKLVYEQGNSFQFVQNASVGKWQLYNLDTTNGSEQRYVNDYDAKGAEVAMYSENDVGNYLNFIPVESTVSIGEIAADDLLVAKHYYNLLGAEVNAPSTTDIYIVKEVYASKKVKIYKMLIVTK